jgi:hypothetical protein
MQQDAGKTSSHAAESSLATLARIERAHHIGELRHVYSAAVPYLPIEIIFEGIENPTEKTLLDWAGKEIQ